jgi:5-formyltetrahydrofolate cyclo-ligase
MNIDPGRQPVKAEIRAALRKARSRLPPAQRRDWDGRINRHLVDYAKQQRAGVVAAFVAFDGEPDLAPALEELDRCGVRVSLPLVRETPTRPVLCFRQWSPGSEMRPNRYGIAEPMGTLEVPLQEIDLVLIPMVAWDARGGRLGMGASFYDRLFEPLADQRRPYRLGVAYQMQQVERIPLDPWDIRLHGVLTEQGIFTCPLGAR